MADTTEQDERKLGKLRVFVWYTDRGIVTATGRNEQDARRKITAQNPHFARLMIIDPVVLDLSQPDAVVYRWRRF